MTQYVFSSVTVVECWRVYDLVRARSILPRELKNDLAYASNLSSCDLIPFMGETVCRAFNFVFIPVFLLYIYTQWRLVAFINDGASKTIIEMSKSSIHRLPKFKGGINKFLTKNARFNTNFYLYK